MTSKGKSIYNEIYTVRILYDPSIQPEAEITRVWIANLTVINNLRRTQYFGGSGEGDGCTYSQYTWLAKKLFLIFKNGNGRDLRVINCTIRSNDKQAFIENGLFYTDIMLIGSEDMEYCLYGKCTAMWDWKYLMKDRITHGYLSEILEKFHDHRKIVEKLIRNKILKAHPPPRHRGRTHPQRRIQIPVIPVHTMQAPVIEFLQSIRLPLNPRTLFVKPLTLLMNYEYNRVHFGITPNFVQPVPPMNANSNCYSSGHEQSIPDKAASKLNPDAEPFDIKRASKRLAPWREEPIRRELPRYVGPISGLVKGTPEKQYRQLEEDLDKLIQSDCEDDISVGSCDDALQQKRSLMGLQRWQNFGNKINKTIEALLKEQKSFDDFYGHDYRRSDIWS